MQLWCMQRIVQCIYVPDDASSPPVELYSPVSLLPSSFLSSSFSRAPAFAALDFCYSGLEKGAVAVHLNPIAVSAAVCRSPLPSAYT
jgi:hypothetical protein